MQKYFFSNYEQVMLAFLTFAIMLIIAYAFWREGLLTSFATLCNIFVAGLLAFNFFEPLAGEMQSFLLDTFLEGFEDAISLTFLFSLTLGLLRFATNNLANEQIELHPLMQQVASVLCALVAGYLVAGFLLCMVQTIPLNEKFMGFEPGVDTRNSSSLRRVLPPDQVWLALMQRASKGPFSASEPTLFDDKGDFELRYARLRRYKDLPNEPAR